MSNVSTQRLVTYVLPGQERKAYATAYTEEEVRHQVALCRARYPLAEVHTRAADYPLAQS